MNLLNKIKDIAGESDTNPSLFNFNSLNTHFVDSIDLILKQPSSLIMLSGGIDSTTLLYLSKKLGIDLTGLEFFYSGRPKAESELIEKITNILQIKYFKVNYPEIFGQDGFKSTFNESNSFYYSIAASFAYKNKIKYVLSGQILDDWIESNICQTTIEFYEILNKMLILEYGEYAPQVLTPFICLSKSQVVKIGKILGVPFSYTRSCTENEIGVCGKCEQCIDRQRVFKENDVLCK